MKRISMSELSRHPSRITKSLTGPVEITLDGKPVAVLTPIKKKTPVRPDIMANLKSAGGNRMFPHQLEKLF